MAKKHSLPTHVSVDKAMSTAHHGRPGRREPAADVREDARDHGRDESTEKT